MTKLTNLTEGKTQTTVFKETIDHEVYSRIIKYLQQRKVIFTTDWTFINNYGDTVILITAQDTQLIPEV